METELGALQSCVCAGAGLRLVPCHGRSNQNLAIALPRCPRAANSPHQLFLNEEAVFCAFSHPQKRKQGVMGGPDGMAHSEEHPSPPPSGVQVLNCDFWTLLKTPFQFK